MQVSIITPKKQKPVGKPDHWVDDKGTTFKNPWKSWHLNTVPERLFLMARYFQFPSGEKAKSQMKIHTPTWGKTNTQDDGAREKIKATWLGHASFLVELPARSNERGLRLLFDPIFSDRCAPVQSPPGPKRFTPSPCKVGDLPEFDAVVISHNHYDHLDTDTIRELRKRSPELHFFAPLGNHKYFRNLGIDESRIHTLDWWETCRIERTLKSEDSAPITADITCTPCQHFSGRNLLDDNKSLWSGWAIEERAGEFGTRPGVKVYFGGDTAYRYVADGQDEDKVPVCPAFKDIGETFGGFDFAMIPVGCYIPRNFMSSIHCAPQDSVRLFQDIKAKRALGMHWGTFVLSTEDVLEPPKKLAEESKKIGLEQGAFTTCDIGETLLF